MLSTRRLQAVQSSIAEGDHERRLLVVPRIMSIDEWEQVAIASQLRLVEAAQSDIAHEANGH